MNRLNKRMLVMVSVVLAIFVVGCGKATSDSVLGLIEKGNFKKANTQLIELEETNRSESAKVGAQVGKEFTEKIEKFASVHQTEEGKKQLIDEISQYKQLISLDPAVDTFIEIVEEVYNIDLMYQLGETAQNNEEYLAAVGHYSMFIELYEESGLTLLNPEFLEAAQRNIEEIAPKVKESEDYNLPVQIVGTLISKNSIGTQQLGVQFKNISDRAIKNIQFSVLGFKEDGTPEKLNFGSSSVGSCNYDKTLAPNEISNGDTRWSIYSEDDQVVHTVISINSVEFYEGEPWSNSIHEYEVNKYKDTTLSKEEIAEMKTKQAKATEEAIAQAEPSPVEIQSSSLRRDRIGGQEVSVQFKNISDKAIKQLTFTVLGYDKNGYPVKLGFGNDEYLNFRYDNTIQPNETTGSNWTWDLHASVEVSKIKIILNDVEFYEEDTWRNIAYNNELNNYIGKVYTE